MLYITLIPRRRNRDGAHLVTGGYDGRIHVIGDALRQRGVKYVARSLPIGDYLFIVRDTLGEEYVLPIIVERKRLDDLCKSMMDGRYAKQKKVMLRCTVFQRRVYLVEGTYSQYRRDFALAQVCLHATEWYPVPKLGYR